MHAQRSTRNTRAAVALLGALLMGGCAYEPYGPSYGYGGGWGGRDDWHRSDWHDGDRHDGGWHHDNERHGGEHHADGDRGWDWQR
jgi:hypothetical protein